jgi:hypothetical protein
MKPADRATVLAFLKLQYPPLVVHEVTRTNRLESRKLYGERFTEGDVVWQKLSEGGAPLRVGVLYALPQRVRVNESRGQRAPFHAEILDRVPGANPEWRTLHFGDAMLDPEDEQSVLIVARMPGLMSAPPSPSPPRAAGR